MEGLKDEETGRLGRALFSKNSPSLINKINNLLIAKQLND